MVCMQESDLNGSDLCMQAYTRMHYDGVLVSFDNYYEIQPSFNVRAMELFKRWDFCDCKRIIFQQK